MAMPASDADLDSHSHPHDFTSLFLYLCWGDAFARRDYLQQMLSFKRMLLLMG
jgi:hypothetical protein